MDGGMSKKGVHFSSLGLFLVTLAEFGSGIFLPQALLLQRELSLSYTQLIWVLAAQFCGVAAGFLRTAGVGLYTRTALAWGLSHFCLGNLLIGLSKDIWGFLFGGFLAGFGRFQIKKSVLAEVVGEVPSSAVSKLAAYRLTSAAVSVLAPLLGAILLQRRGAREGAYLLSFFAAFFLLFALSILPKSGKTHPVSGDIAIHPPALEGVLTPLPLFFCLLRGAGELLKTATGVFLFAISGNFFLAALVLSLLTLSLWLYRVAITA